jgi:hypothetical protein
VPDAGKPEWSGPLRHDLYALGVDDPGHAKETSVEPVPLATGGVEALWPDSDDPTRESVDSVLRLPNRWVSREPSSG